MSNIESVAAFIVRRQKELGLANADLANALNYENHNVITMIRKGRTKLPLDKVAAMASVLQTDPAWLFRKVLGEYAPDTLEAIEVSLGPIVTKNERAMLDAWRRATNTSDPDISPDLANGFLSIMLLRGRTLKTL